MSMELKYGIWGLLSRKSTSPGAPPTRGPPNAALNALQAASTIYIVSTSLNMNNELTIITNKSDMDKRSPITLFVYKWWCDIDSYTHINDLYLPNTCTTRLYSSYISMFESNDMFDWRIRRKCAEKRSSWCGAWIDGATCIPNNTTILKANMQISCLQYTTSTQYNTTIQYKNTVWFEARARIPHSSANNINNHDNNIYY